MPPADEPPAAGGDDEITARLREVVIGEIEQRPIVLVDPDPTWPGRFEREAERIRGALGDRVALLEHVGSTAVPGLAAKPIIDICLAVPDSADEPAYVPQLERAGYELRVREPDWQEHRMLRTPARDVHIHVFSAGCPEVARMLRFRDHLRADPADRQRYEGVKRDLAARPWPTMQHYADAKSGVVEAIVARADRRRADDEPGR